VVQSVPQGAYIGVRFDTVIDTRRPEVVNRVTEVVPLGINDWKHAV
jgi:hypothetical protein